MHPIVYYMPLSLTSRYKEVSNHNTEEFLSMFCLTGVNSCLIDRTGHDVFNMPFTTHILDKIPSTTHDESFEQLCIQRAMRLLKTQLPITLAYSGGIDSTTMLLSFVAAIESGVGAYEQVTISTSLYARVENPKCWDMYLFRKPWKSITPIQTTLNRVSEIDFNTNPEYFLFGENADQLFGSDLQLPLIHMLHEPTTTDTLWNFVKTKSYQNRKHVDYLVNCLEKLWRVSPVELTTFGDFLWWFNFSCKWQAVSLRILYLTNMSSVGIPLSTLEYFRTFYNTPEYQSISMYGGLEKWGAPQHPTNYKLAARKFISNFTGCDEYSQRKIKVPSLIRVFNSIAMRSTTLALVDHNIKMVDDIHLQ